MKRILLGDVGSTKADWACIMDDYQATFSTEGYNPLSHPVTRFDSMLAEIQQHCSFEIDRIYYYGTGVIDDSIRDMLQRGFHTVYRDARIFCESDILAAARSLSEGKQSMIGILGTGSNSCFFDGARIVRQIPSLGFPLGDEGSGADIGKACVRAFYYDLMPSGIRDSFARVLPADRSVFLRQYLDHPAPNKFLAELVPVVIEHLQAPFIRGLLLECFRTFARLHLKPYRIEAPVHLSGGVAYACQELLRNVLLEEQLIPGSIVISPLPGLIKFHQAHFEDINE